MTGMDQGVGQASAVTRGPAQYAVGQMFVMGKESDDWAVLGAGGKEIVGNAGAADAFKLGNQLEVSSEAAQSFDLAAALRRGPLKG
jgi:hypothetical protein